jgi:ring-1,2-phenylacetyl-CoA epoxidase subunit PaaD
MMGEGTTNASDAGLVDAHAIAAAVVDPEIPVLTLEDLGVLRGVERRKGRIVVKLTPTYTGCPATLAIEQAIRAALDANGYARTEIMTTLDPPWTTDWITKEGHEKLRRYGIAPPQRAARAECPQCGAHDTEEVSRFGSTPCKALWRCRAGLDPATHRASARERKRVIAARRRAPDGWPPQGRP